MADHLVTGITEVVITCGGCTRTWTQPIFADERLGWHVCPHCLEGAPVKVEHELLDRYEARA